MFKRKLCGRRCNAIDRREVLKTIQDYQQETFDRRTYPAAYSALDKIYDYVFGLDCIDCPYGKGKKRGSIFKRNKRY